MSGKPGGALSGPGGALARQGSKLNPTSLSTSRKEVAEHVENTPQLDDNREIGSVRVVKSGYGFVERIFPPPSGPREDIFFRVADILDCNGQIQSSGDVIMDCNLPQSAKVQSCQIGDRSEGTYSCKIREGVPVLRLV